jgi:5-methylcytosine-specific restriction endonuclease McrA
MARRPNTTRWGDPFDEVTVDEVWEVALAIPQQDSAEYRTDSCGAKIQRSAFGNTKSAYGWEIDHIKPIVLGGTDEAGNLQPLHWKNNRHKADNWPNWTCEQSA